MKITNHHSHTFRCKHAQGDAVDYVRHAFQGGASVYGISDHSPIPDGRYPEVRMAMEELDSYENAVRKAQSEFPEVKVYCWEWNASISRNFMLSMRTNCLDGEVTII